MNNRGVFLWAVVLAARPVVAALELGAPFADGAVLQRDRDVPVWGWAEAGREVVVSFAGEKVSALAGPDGGWQVKLPPMAASKEGRTLTVVEREPGFFGTQTDEVVVSDVLVGEVWMCSGQSNCAVAIWDSSPRHRDGWGAMMMDTTDRPWVRLVKARPQAATRPLRTGRANWLAMTPKTLNRRLGCALPSAMGWYYALELANALDIPIGIVDCSDGGLSIDTWTPPSGYAGMDELADVAALPVLDEAGFAAARKDGAYATRNLRGDPTLFDGGWKRQPSAHWNGTVAAFAPMAVRGLIWYQGCANVREPERYAAKMHALYNGWKREFRNPDLEMYFVQLAPWRYENIAAMQMAQARFAAEEPHAAMTVINDVGNLDDIHPNDKRTVAKRLSLHALKRVYGWDWVEDESPILREWKVEDGRVILSFDHAAGWYVYNPDGSMSTGFELCGPDGVWHPARIANLVEGRERGRTVFRGAVDGRDLVIVSDQVRDPKRLRYLHNRPWFGSLYSEANLPLGAFAVDGLAGTAAPYPFCNAMVCPERTNDFVWENDKFGMRAYGPGEHHKWSGLDVFNKSNPSNVCIRWTRDPLYNRHDVRPNFHQNMGEGMDNYTMGAARGVGGVAIFADGEWKTYPDWESCRVLHVGDDYLEFELVYPACCSAGKMTYHITLKRGERFFRNDVSFEKPFARGFCAGPGIDLEAKRDHHGSLVEDGARGLVSLFEDPKGEDGRDGSTMEAIFVARGSDCEMMTDNLNCRVLAFKTNAFTYWAGASWSGAGEITDARTWHECVKAFQDGL